MPYFFYDFSYETPRQRRNNQLHGWDDQNSKTFIVIADDVDRARAWGDEIALRYMTSLYTEAGEELPTESFWGRISRPADVAIHDGQFPDVAAWLEDDRP